MYLLYIIREGIGSSADGPDWFVGNGERSMENGNFLQLFFDNFLCFSFRAFLQRFPDTQDGVEVESEGGNDLFGNGGIGFPVVLPALTVATEHVGAAHILEHVHAHITCESALWFWTSALSPYIQFFLDTLGDVWEGGEDDNICPSLRAVGGIGGIPPLGWCMHFPVGCDEETAVAHMSHFDYTQCDTFVSSMQVHRVVLAADHAGFALKEELKKNLEGKGVGVIDVSGPFEEGNDYPPLIRKGCEFVLKYGIPGIMFGGSGNGEAMAANKMRGIRAAVGYSVETANLARAHNDANVLSIGARFMDVKLACAMVDTFLATPFEGGRHEQRVANLE